MWKPTPTDSAWGVNNRGRGGEQGHILPLFEGLGEKSMSTCTCTLTLILSHLCPAFPFSNGIGAYATIPTVYWYSVQPNPVCCPLKEISPDWS